MNYKTILCVLLTALLLAVPASAATAGETLNACVAKLRGAKSLRAEFSTNASGRAVSGTLLSKGSKFSLTMPGVGTWYDGRDMWTYSQADNEATVWHPTKAELSETNPLLYLATASGYNVKAEKSAKGESAMTLTPKKRGTGVKSIRVVINTKTNLPKSMRIAMSGGTYTVTIKSIALNPAISDSSFIFPRSKYKGVTVTDLR